MDIVTNMRSEPCDLYTLLEPLYFTDLIVTDEKQIEKKRQEVVAYIETCSQKKVDVFPDSFLSLRPPHFQYSYHNKNNVELFRMFSTFYQTVCGWSDERGGRDCRSLPVARSRINVAFVSNMFSRLSSVLRDRQGIIRKLSRDEFHITLVTFDKARDVYAKQLFESVDRVLILNRKLQDQLAWMKKFNFDVIVYDDLNMCGETLGISHHRLAPVQINTWGHSDTSSISTIDYYISSQLYETEDAQELYSEKLILHNSLCTFYERPIDPSKITFKPRSHFGLAKDAIVYLCYQSLFKISPQFQEAIKHIVEADERNVVVFVKGFMGDQEQILFYERFEELLGFPAVQRIHMLERQTMLNINNLVHVSDVVLDTFPFGGCNTSLECFNLGKPVVTLPSQHIHGRFTYGFYKTMGIDEFIVDSVEDYVEKAVLLGQDETYRNKWSATILEKSNVLWDDETSVKEWETTLAQLVKPYVNRVNMVDYLRKQTFMPVQQTGPVEATVYTDDKNATATKLLTLGFTIEKNGDKVQFIDGVWVVRIDCCL